MLRSSVSLPLRLFRDAAPAQRHFPSALPTAVLPFQRQSAQQPQQSRPFSTTEPLSIKRRGVIPRQIPKLKKKKRFPTPQAKRVSEARYRKNVARQAVLEEERALAYGDPVWGKAEATDFVKSFDTAVDADEVILEGATEPSTRSSAAATEAAVASRPGAKQSPLLNAFYRADEVVANLAVSRQLTAPVESERLGGGDPTLKANRDARHAADHDTASEAINRILAVGQTNGKQRKHVNIQRCVEKFGRHNTDPVLLAVEKSTVDDGEVDLAEQEKKLKERVGPDTGSSEVQIALLTLKIRKLAHDREGPLRRDKINKRNLRIMLHKRQKLLKYFYKKNRGGPRWQYLVDTLGLTDANWHGEIMLR